MRLLLLSSTAALALALSTAAFADNTAAAPTATPAAAQPSVPAPSTAAGANGTATAALEDPDEVICRQQAAMTGTRLGAPRVCRKRKDWDKLQKEAAESLGHMQTNGLTGGGFVKAPMQAGPTGH